MRFDRKLSVLAVCLCSLGCADFHRGPAPRDAGADAGADGDAALVADWTFEIQVYPILESRCQGCHQGGGMAGSTRFVLTGNARMDRAMVVADGDVFCFSARQEKHTPAARSSPKTTPTMTPSPTGSWACPRHERPSAGLTRLSRRLRNLAPGFWLKHGVPYQVARGRLSIQGIAREEESPPWPGPPIDRGASPPRTRSARRCDLRAPSAPVWSRSSAPPRQGRAWAKNRRAIPVSTWVLRLFTRITTRGTTLARKS